MMNRNDELAEYIRRAHEITKPVIENYVDPRKTWEKKYRESEKGKKTLRKGWKKRQRQISKAKANRSWEEISRVAEFYRNTPKGYQVDHIIPVSKGGKHILSNLQYLTEEDNRRKYNKIYVDLKDEIS